MTRKRKTRRTRQRIFCFFPFLEEKLKKWRDLTQKYTTSVFSFLKKRVRTLVREERKGLFPHALRDLQLLFFSLSHSLSITSLSPPGGGGSHQRSGKGTLPTTQGDKNNQAATAFKFLSPPLTKEPTWMEQQQNTRL